MPAVLVNISNQNIDPPLANSVGSVIANMAAFIGFVTESSKCKVTGHSSREVK
jgi:hypothetical protein